MTNGGPTILDVLRELRQGGASTAACLSDRLNAPYGAISSLLATAVQHCEVHRVSRSGEVFYRIGPKTREMPKIEIDEPFADEEDVWFFEKLNAFRILCEGGIDHGYDMVKETRAKKDHVDAFGAPIFDGDLYYVIHRWTGHWSGNMKVSAESMKSLLAIVMAQPMIEGVADALIKRRLKETP